MNFVHLSIFIACFVFDLFNIVSHCAGKDEKVKLEAAVGPGYLSTIRINLAGSDISKDDFCGLYRHPYDLTAGHALHIFPDSTIVLERFGDVIASSVIADGTWTIVDNYIKIDWKFVEESSVEESSYRSIRYGKMSNLELYSSKKNNYSHSILAISHDKRLDSGIHYFIKVAEYRNWQAIIADLKRKRK